MGAMFLLCSTWRHSNWNFIHVTATTAYFVTYDDIKTSFVRLVPDLKDDTRLKHLKRSSVNSGKRGSHQLLTPLTIKLQSPPKRSWKIEGYRWQVVEPYNHHVTAAARNIHTFNNHFTSGLSPTDFHLPL